MSPFMLCFGGSWRDTGQGDGLLIMKREGNAEESVS